MSDTIEPVIRYTLRDRLQRTLSTVRADQRSPPSRDMISPPPSVAAQEGCAVPSDYVSNLASRKRG